MTTNNITPDDILSDADNRRLSEMMAIKKHVYAFINKKELLKFILHIIDSTEVVAFERKHDRRFLNLMNLSMALQLDVKKATEKYEVSDLKDPKKNGSRETTMTARANFLRELIVVPFTDLMGNMLSTIIDKEPDEDYQYSEWIFNILPENYKELRNSVSSFIELEDGDKEKIKNDLKFMYGMCSAFVFPPEEVDLNEDTGFTLEFLL